MTELVMMAVVCTLGWIGWQAPSHVTLPGRYCPYPQFTGEERFSNPAGVTSWQVVAPGFSPGPVFSQQPLLYLQLCPPTPVSLGLPGLTRRWEPSGHQSLDLEAP